MVHSDDFCPTAGFPNIVGPGVSYLSYLTFSTGLYVYTTSLSFLVIVGERRAAST